MNKIFSDVFTSTPLDINKLEEIIDYLIENPTKDYSLNVFNVSPSTLENLLCKLKFEITSIDSNGWDHAFWLTYDNDTIRIVHTGSWFYGNSVLRIDN